jgi:Escherichia/Staphylococcus phage prohead protease
MDLEHKFARFGDGLVVGDDAMIEGYASLFGQADQGGDIVQKGAYAASIAKLKKVGQRVKMLWQHDPAQPIGVWDEVREDDKGLWVKGRLLDTTQKGREAAALIGAGAIDGLSIGYRTTKANKNDKGQRLLTELELWEVSLVTFPMLPSARVAAKGDSLAIDDTLRDLAAAFDGARLELARR